MVLREFHGFTNFSTVFFLAQEKTTGNIKQYDLHKVQTKHNSLLKTNPT